MTDFETQVRRVPMHRCPICKTWTSVSPHDASFGSCCSTWSPEARETTGGRMKTIGGRMKWLALGMVLLLVGCMSEPTSFYSVRCTAGQTVLFASDSVYWYRGPTDGGVFGGTYTWEFRVRLSGAAEWKKVGARFVPHRRVVLQGSCAVAPA